MFRGPAIWRSALCKKIIAPDPRWTDDHRLKRQTAYAAAYAALRPLHARLLDD